MLSDLKRRASP